MASTHIYGLLKFNNKSKKYVGGGNFLSNSIFLENKSNLGLPLDSYRYIPPDTKSESIVIPEIKLFRKIILHKRIVGYQTIYLFLYIILLIIPLFFLWYFL